jgi:hypothetical protein
VNRLQLAVDQIVFARNYTLHLLEQTPTTDWFRLPPGSVSHVGWQVGHIAFAEYRMLLFRIRGQQPEDDRLFSPEFLRLFGANSVPDADPGKYPAPADVRAVLDRVHEQALQVISGLNDAALDEPISVPHPFVKNKLQSLLWCGHHEMLHAGQIGLLRRHLGYPPTW